MISNFLVSRNKVKGYPSDFGQIRLVETGGFEIYLLDNNLGETYGPRLKVRGQI